MDDFSEIIYFIDVASKQNAFIIVRVVGDKVGIAISLEDDGDIEAFLPNDTSGALVETLNRALTIARNTDIGKESAQHFPDHNNPDQGLNPDKMAQK